MLRPRPKQAEVLRFRSGKMGVSAVPGSGKTHTLSMLAAQLVQQADLADDQEVLIVTLVNSAVDNFAQRIQLFLKGSGLLPGMNYRVRTLHGLAHDIVRERPDLVGLSDRFEIIDERDANRILDDAAETWLRNNPLFYELYAADFSNPHDQPKYYKKWHETVMTVAGSFIRLSKDLQMLPEDLKPRLDALQDPPLLLRMGYEIFRDYQRALQYRSAVDFDDLIRLALQALQTDAGFLNRLRRRWPFILEDEAQDSSRLQEEILRLLVGEQGSWVRVGDPNQAIYETFTTANPKYLRNFLTEPGVDNKELPNSGRSTHSIIWLANTLIDWARQEHPVSALRDTLTLPHIQPTPPGDPQPNPQDKPHFIHLSDKALSPEQEIRSVVQSVKKWLEEKPGQTAAILVPRNERGAKMVDALREAQIDYVELLRSSLPTRRTANILACALFALSEPADAPRLSDLYQALNEDVNASKEIKAQVRAEAQILRSCRQVEQFLYPLPNEDWLEMLRQQESNEETIFRLENLRSLLRRWQPASILPVDQLIITMAQDVFDQPNDLALAYKLALVLERYQTAHPAWNLRDFAQELREIANNERKFDGFSREDNGFDPDLYKGKVVVATVHKAKGLEWDRIYLLSVNNYDFPSALEGDSFIAERWYVRDRLNLQAECLAKLTALIENDIPGVYLEEGTATNQARLDYAAERLRLFFVGITRARQELVVTWNTGRENAGSQACQAALPLQELAKKWEEHHHASA